MNQIFNLFIKQNKTSNLEQSLLKLDLFSENPKISMGDIIYLIESFEGIGQLNTKFDGQQVIRTFLKICQPQKSATVTIKINISLHLMLYEYQIGDQVSLVMLESSLSGSNQNNQCYDFIQNYNVYLLKFAQALRIFYSARIGMYPIMEEDKNSKIDLVLESEQMLEEQIYYQQQFYKQKIFGFNNLQNQRYQWEKTEQQTKCVSSSITDQQKTIFLFKLLNLITLAQTVIIKAIEHINNQLEEKKLIFIEASCLLWNDIMVMYKFMAYEITRFLVCLKKYDQETLNSIQQLYISMIEITEKIISVYKQKKIFDLANLFKSPSWFEEKQSITQQLQNAIFDQKVIKRKQTQALSRKTLSVHVNPLASKDDIEFKCEFQLPLSPQSKLSSSIKMFPSTSKSQSKSQIFFQKLSGGLFDDQSMIMSPTMIAVQTNKSKIIKQSLIYINGRKQNK